MKLLLLNGPNLNLTGRRETEIYGMTTLADIEKKCRDIAAVHGAELECFQSNHEGALIDKIQQVMGECDGIVMNPGALTHYSYSLRDAVACCEMPVIEVHMSDIRAREPFRAVSVTEEVCAKSIIGHGAEGYYEAVEMLLSGEA